MTIRIKVDTIDGRKKQHVLIRPDHRHPGRIFYSGPAVASLTPHQVIELANALADALETEVDVQ